MRVRRNVIASVKGPVHLNFCLTVLAMKRPTDPSLPLKVILVLTRLGQRVLSVVQLGCFSRVLGGSLVAFTLHGNNQKQSKTSTVHSDSNISARSELNQASKSSPRPNNPGLSRAESLELVPENTSIQKPAPPPPAPTLSSEFGVMLKRPPDCYYPKKGPAKNIFPGPVKYGKYGVLDSQLA